MAKILVRNSQTGLLGMRVDSGSAKGHLMYTEPDGDVGSPPPGDPCDLESCGSVGARPEQDNPPAMRVTVFDADYSGPSISFAGKTWTEAEVQAGDFKCACPTTYQKITTPEGSPQILGELWRHLSASGSLRLARTWSAFTFSTLLAQQHKVDIEAGPNGLDLFDWKLFNGFSTFKNTFDIGVLDTNDPLPTENENALLAEQFGSVTDSGGVLYSWAKTFTRWDDF